MIIRKPVTVTAATLTMVGLVACGGSSSSPSTPTATPRPVANAGVTASGVGYLVAHPSQYPTWGYALEAPIRITETGGGTAQWNYARLSVVRGDREIERSEIGADILSSAPDWSNITPRQNSTYTLLFRLNSDAFDSIDITLGFTDVRSARQFTADLPFDSFSGVNISLTAASVPPPAVIRRLP